MTPLNSWDDNPLKSLDGQECKSRVQQECKVKSVKGAKSVKGVKGDFENTLDPSLHSSNIHNNNNTI